MKLVDLWRRLGAALELLLALRNDVRLCAVVLEEREAAAVLAT